MLSQFPITPRPWESLNEARKALREKLHYVRGRWGFKTKESLTYNGDNDFTLNEGQDSVWIQVDDFIVYIRRNENAVVAQIMTDDNETEKLVELDVAVAYRQRKAENQ
ncbi:MAG: hypothetical protein HN726_05645 [Candidatus Magasanikbacteria bacterium]|jgi:hypothetical protein|nr:hypothetical protein [Candidatus Magasanikbacteria bacterium]